MVAWSWDLLDESEQAMARRLTVFAGGATLEAAERVCGLPEELLTSLVEKSLVEVVGGRYRMLETIRAFCAERLSEAGEVETYRRAHAAYYGDLADAADPHLRQAEQLEWLAMLDKERDNLNAALRWAVDEGAAADGLRLVGALSCYWWIRGRRAESAAMAAELLAVVGTEPEEGLEDEYAMCVLASAWAEQRQPVDLGPLMYDGSRAFRREFLNVMLPMFQGPPDDYDVIATMTAAAIDEISPWLRGLNHAGLAFMQQNLGRHRQSWIHFEQSLDHFRELGESGAARSPCRAWPTSPTSRATTPPRSSCSAGHCHWPSSWVRSRTSPTTAAAWPTASCAWATWPRPSGSTLRVVELAGRSGARETSARAHLGLGEVARRRGDAVVAKAAHEAGPWPSAPPTGTARRTPGCRSCWAWPPPSCWRATAKRPATGTPASWRAPRASTCPCTHRAQEGLSALGE
ncbi:hypothetical protein [Nonomuraea dietziae]|uniref:ATP-binding protein n=1 Tax=Nonomuraea dietziae TaxID=65515 RepID=UPI0031CF108B